MYLVFYLSNIPRVHFELITVSSVKKTQTSVFTKQDRLCFTLVAQQFKLNFSCCASVWSVTSFESHLVCCICKTNKIGQRPDASTAIFTALLQTEALKWVLCATTYENVSTNVNQYSKKRRNCSQDSEASFTKGRSVTRRRLSQSFSLSGTSRREPWKRGRVCAQWSWWNKTVSFFNSALQRLTKRHLFLSLLYVFHSDFIVFTSPTVTGKCDLVPARGCDHHLLNVESFTGGTRQVLTHLDIYNLCTNGREGLLFMAGARGMDFVGKKTGMRNQREERLKV